jgi:alpha-ketoglutarate-dependent sulfate ester dioxygenase
VTDTLTVASDVDVHVGKLTTAIGAEITGADLSRPLDDAVVARLRTALLAHKVIFLRGQDLDYDQLVAFGRRLGDLTLGHPIYGGPEGRPHLREMDSRGEGTRANHWHADFTYMSNPPAFAVLHNKVCPPVGGDTMWANAATAYANLPEGLRTLADGLRAVHCNDSDFTDATYSGPTRTDYLKNVFASEHPVVRVHPETGERCLMLGGFIRSIPGYSPQAGRDLVRALQEYATVPENTVRWKWQVGDLVIWDNQATLHYAVHDYGDQHRRGERVTVAGTTTVGIDGREGYVLQGDASAFTRGNRM